MRRLRVKLAIGVAVLGVVVTATVAVAGDRSRSDFRTSLTGYEEVPALSTPGLGSFKAAVSRRSQEIRYELRYEGFGTPVQQAHIHFEQQTNNGPIVAFLCSNLANKPAGVQACPTPGGTVRGTITPAQVGGNQGATDAGIATGEFGELVSAMRAGVTYVNVHTDAKPGGEIRGQLDAMIGGHHR